MNIKSIAILLSVGINMMPRNFTHTLYLRPMESVENNICFSLRANYDTNVDFYVKDEIICSKTINESDQVIQLDKSLLKYDCLDINCFDLEQKKYQLKIWYHSKINRIQNQRTIVYDHYYFSSNDIMIQNQKSRYLSFSDYQPYLDLNSGIRLSAFIYPHTTLEYVPSVSLYIIAPKNTFFFLPYDEKNCGYYFPLNAEQVSDRLFFSLKNNCFYQKGTFELKQTQKENDEKTECLFFPNSKEIGECQIRFVFQMKEYQIICEYQCIFSNKKVQVQFL